MINTIIPRPEIRYYSFISRNRRSVVTYKKYPTVGVERIIILKSGREKKTRLDFKRKGGNRKALGISFLFAVDYSSVMNLSCEISGAQLVRRVRAI